MILQKIVFPYDIQKECDGLYFKSNKPLEILSRYSVKLLPNCCLKLFSYYNNFSVTKWHCFSTVVQITVNASLSGTGKIRLMFRSPNNISCVQELNFSSVRPEKFQLEPQRLLGQGFYYIEIQSDSDSSVFLYEADFSTEMPPVNFVNIAIITCTFKREHYIVHNMEKIQKEILEQADSQLQEHLCVFIIDNGQSLSGNLFRHEKILLFANKNIGGSGGFTKGLIEVLHRKNSCAFTHALLMDDDVAIDTESIERTYSLLCYMKQDFHYALVGGAMLRDDIPYMLEEAGANWIGSVQSIGHGWDLRSAKNLFRYDAIGKVDYQAWWYCCIPLDAICLNNLPLPFFIHGDDMEFGMRNFDNVIQLNGICVWHNTFENKRPSHLEYYDIRNHLILNSIHGKNASLASQLLGIFKRSTALILRMRYNDIYLIVRGIDDFLKGPKWWASRDIVSLHKEILSLGYQYQPIANILKQQLIDASRPISKTMRCKCLLTLNGALFPKKSSPIMVACGGPPFALYRRRQAYLWDPSTDKAIYVNFSLRKLVKMYGILSLAFVRLIIKYPKIKRCYQSSYKSIGTEIFWKHHITLEN